MPPPPISQQVRLTELRPMAAPVPPFLAGCTEQEREELKAAAASAGLVQWPAKIICLSLSGPDLPSRIAAGRAAGQTMLGIATAAQGQARVEALAAGVDELLTSGPVQPAELAARLRLLGSGSALAPEMHFDERRSTLLLYGSTVPLRGREVPLVRMLWQARGGFVTHAALLAGAWDANAVERREYLRVAISRLRERMEPEPDLPRYLLSEPAIGYRLGDGQPRSFAV
jgi:two-component system KDP operon response regulator KdpE